MMALSKLESRAVILFHFDCLFFFPSMNLDFLGGSVKNLPAVQETWVQSLGQEDPLEKGSDELNGSLASVNSQG